MIPYSILACELRLQDASLLPVRILDLTADGFSFRLPPDLIPDPSGPLHIHFYSFKTDAFRTVRTTCHTIVPEEKNEFYTIYRFTSEDPVFLEALKAFLAEYIALIRLKSELEPAEASEALTGYPAEQEAFFSPSYEAWLKKQLSFPFEKTDLSDSGKLLALCPDRPSLYEAWLSQTPGAFKASYFSACGLKDHPLETLPFQILYIGNSFCAHLLPAPQCLTDLWQKALQAGLYPVLQLPPLKESSLPLFCSLLEALSETDPQAEIICNDPGVLALLGRDHHFRLTAGLFYNRTRQDPRFPYRNGYASHKDLYKVMSSELLCHRLSEAGFTRIELEEAQTQVSFPASLHLPYIRLNTGGFCPLYAAVRNHNPSLQEEVYACTHFCEKSHFLYPDFLKTIGMFNSTFMLRDDFLKKPGRLTAYPRIDRIVLEIR